VVDGSATVDTDVDIVDAITVVETDGAETDGAETDGAETDGAETDRAETDKRAIDRDGATGATDASEIPAAYDDDAAAPEDAVIDDDNAASDAPAVVPRQRTLTLVTPEPGISTTRGVTPDGLPQRVRPSGRIGNAIRLVTETVPAEPADGTGELEDVRTDGDATPPEAPRTPERMRTMLTSFQDGTTLGRRRAQASFAAVPADETAGPDVAAPTDRPTQVGDPAAAGDAHATGEQRAAPEDADGTADHADSDTAGSEQGMPDR
jgi:hypothetical protein